MSDICQGPGCEAEIPSGDRYCERCGQKIQIALLAAKCAEQEERIRELEEQVTGSDNQLTSKQG